MSNGSKWRVLQMIRSLDIAGAEKYGIELARSLPRDQFDIQICAFFETHTENEVYWRNLLNAEKIDVVSFGDINTSRRMQNYISGYTKLSKFVQKNQVDLIHSHFSMGTMMGILLKDAGLTQYLIRTAHGLSRYEWSPRWYSKPWRWLLFQWVYPARLDGETGVSEMVASELQEPHRLSRCARKPRMIHNGISAEFIQAARAAPKIHEDSEYLLIGSIGRLTEQKGFIYLIQAMPLLISSLPKLKLEILGEGELKDALLAEIEKLGLQDTVKILGKQSDVIPFLKRLDLFVLPSLWEGLPTIALESMACGTPVLATDIPGTRELIVHEVSGWLVEPANPAALAAGIKHVLDSLETLTRVSLLAQEQVEQFSFSKITAEISQFYQSILTGEAGTH